MVNSSATNALEVLVNQDRSLGKAHKIAIYKGFWGNVGGLRRTECDEQRGEVLDGWVGVGHTWRIGFEIREFIYVARRQCFRGPLIEIA